jgi:hypothetical protein
MADVCKLVVDHDHLVLVTHMPSNRQVQALEFPIEGLHGTNTIRVERDDGIEEPSLFYLVNNDTEQPDASLVQTQISLTGGQLLIHQHVQTREGWKVISFSQGGDAGSDQSGANAVTLTVTRGNAPDRRVQCSAPDWVTFRRCFGREVNLYLRPLLRTMRQESVFAIDSAVAWQVFRDEWPQDGRVGRRIQALLPAFDADNFATRNRAWKSLCNEGIAGALYLNEFDSSKLSAEQETRVNAFLSRFPLLAPDEVDESRADPHFLLDCLYGPDDDIRTIALHRLDGMLHQDLTYPQVGPQEEQHATIDKWRSQIPAMNMAQANTR